MHDPTVQAESPPWAGLSEAEAARRLSRDGPNQLPGDKPRPLLAIVGAVVAEPMFLMLLVAGGIYLLLGDRAEALFLLGFVFVVIGMTLAQERKTQRALEALRDLSAPRAQVVRDGEARRIAGRDVVRGDVLVLREGDRVAADAVLVQGRIAVDESLLTGESVTVTKRADADGSAPFPAPGSEASAGAVYASTVVTQGVGFAVVRATGAFTAVGRIGEAMAATSTPPSSLQRGARRLIQRLTVVALLLSALLVVVDWRWQGMGLLESLLAGIALAMAILPQEITVILTVFLALGAWRLAQSRVLARQIPAVEVLGAMTVLAVDKTGTLTQNRMQVAELAADGAVFDANDPAPLPEAFHLLVEFAMLATPPDPFDPMEKAIQAFGHAQLAGTEHVHDDSTPEFQYPLDSAILAMTRVYSGTQPREYQLATKGAPEAVADLCHLAEDARAHIQHQVEAMAARGLRVLGVARGAWQRPSADAGWPESQHDFDFSFLGLVGFLDPLRDDAPAAIAECRAAGVRLLMLTGDHPATARAIARQAGLSECPEVLTGTEIDALDDAALRARLRRVDICARLQPAQKLRLVRLLQQDGDVVAMTGDGVNDAPALKAADVGIAMGAHGTDVAREAAALVLLDDSLASIVGAVRHGRRLDANLAKATRFVFAVHLPIVALTLLPALLHWGVLLLPVHIVLLEMLIDPACSVVFEADPAASDIMRKPPRTRTANPFAAGNIGFALAQGFGIAVILLGASAVLRQWGWAEPQTRIAVFTALVSTLFLLILANRDLAHTALRNVRGNPLLPRMFGGVAVVLAVVLTIPLLRDLMGFGRIGLPPLLAALGMLLACGLWLQALHAVDARSASVSGPAP